MQVADNSVEETIARWDVASASTVGEFPTLDIAGTDFKATDDYEWFEVPFTLPLQDKLTLGSKRQYRVAYSGAATLTIDRIEVIGQFGSG